MSTPRLDGEVSGQIDELMELFYRVVSFEEGGSPDWESMAGLFSKQARITRVTPEAIDHLDLKGFRSMAEELIEVGAFTSFFEREIARRMDRFGSVMHIASAYETRISPDAVTPRSVDDPRPSGWATVGPLPPGFVTFSAFYANETVVHVSTVPVRADAITVVAFFPY